MSEYQYYEFLAVDRPLSEPEQAEVRTLSTRAEITATGFVNEYEWGEFRGDPTELVRRYYDAHLYLADWGTRRILLRLPREGLTGARRYAVDELFTVEETDDHVLLDLLSEDDEGDWDYDPHEALPVIAGVRAELLTGDPRPLYLAWLAAYGTWERDEDAFDTAAEDILEPPVPPGLDQLTEPQRELARFLRVDDVLLAVAAGTDGSRRTVAELLDTAALNRTGVGGPLR
ncbi:hypothetical protein BLA60_14435 [Actinophytocola xinjiangensis]|uniref:Uncharacterized protein n=1 Tax=Actinophytocola xinjiangensis TaxID=485602 RepID=A0A7Z0WMZ4_9PSEU|nr:hypothetical protein [Actinophytocola xinjiangensis]OLF11177.1 hypothetical protein BLA60_14435 [Actinophytocola xinjiangensis]